MPLISFKEIIMFVLGCCLIYSLYFLRTHDDLFVQPLSAASITAVPAVTTEVTPPVEIKTLPQAVLEQVQIPNWLTNKEDFDISNLTLDDLLELARISHEQDHDFFPDNQNTLFYLLKAKELGVESAEVDELLTTVHASLYDQAEQAISAYDAKTLTALTARLKSIAADDPNIQQYTNQISVFYTLERLTNEIKDHIANDRIYEDDQDDAVHTIIMAEALGADYQPLLALKDQVINQISQSALRAAQELDFQNADEQIRRLTQLAVTHPITTQTIYDIQNQKQNRFAYLDQQFYTAINNLNLERARSMIEALDELEIASNQLSGYQSLYAKTKLYGPHDVFDEFNDLLRAGNNGPTMVAMPTGDFFMGSQTGAKHQRPVHLVEISYGFAVSKFEVTVAEFERFIQATNYTTTAESNNRAKIYDERTGRFKNKYNVSWRHDYLGKKAEPNLPVIHVSWEDAYAYVNWLSQETGENYRLLSESEFEYILSMGNDYKYPWGNDEPQDILGNFSGAKDKFKKSRIRWREGFSDYSDGYWGPAPVGSFIQNLFGLNDLSGNVMEWVDDCWHDSYTRAPGDGSAWVNRGCENRVIRGGNWGSSQDEYTTHHRIKAANNFTDPRLGFRVAKTFNY